MFAMFAAGALLLLLDQWSKRTVRRRVRDGCIRWGPVVQIRRVPGLKTMCQGHFVRATLVLAWFGALASAVLLYRSGVWFQSNVALLGLGMAFGGALGNLFDILRWRYVVDFIDLRWWPVFNVADVAILCGLAVALWQRS